MSNEGGASGDVVSQGAEVWETMEVMVRVPPPSLKIRNVWLEICRLSIAACKLTRGRTRPPLGSVTGSPMAMSRARTSDGEKYEPVRALAAACRLATAPAA